jgi:predicted DNA-binding antitoxin AbrB/MazE fold protein
MAFLTVQAIYEEGILRPVHPLPLQEHECVVLEITRRGTVQETSGRLQGLPPDVVEAIAEGEEYSGLTS